MLLNSKDIILNCRMVLCLFYKHTYAHHRLHVRACVRVCVCMYVWVNIPTLSTLSTESFARLSNTASDIQLLMYDLPC